MAASIKCDERPFKGGSGGALPPQPKIGGSGGQRPPAKNISKIFEKKIHIFSRYTVSGTRSGPSDRKHQLSGDDSLDKHGRSALHYSCHHGLVDQGGRRSVRSVARSVDRVDRFGRFGNFADFSIFLPCRGARDLSGVKVSALYDAWRPKKCRKTETRIFHFFGSVGSVFRSVRSILRPRAVVDHPGYRAVAAVSG